MTITVSLWYVVDCSECIAEVRHVVNGAVVDMQVTRLTLTAGDRHNHDVTLHLKEVKGTVNHAALRAAGQQQLPGTESIAPPPTNGFDSGGI